MDLLVGSFIAIIGGLLVFGTLFMLGRDLIRRRREARERRIRGKKNETGERRLSLTDHHAVPATVGGRMVKRFDTMIGDAGMEMSPAAARVMMLGLASVVAAALLFIFDTLTAAMIGFMFGALILFPLFSWRRTRRRRKMEDQLPEALYLLARAVRAGESSDQALALVARETPDPLKHEFSRTARQLTMGLSMADTMRIMAHRAQIDDLRLFATTLMIHRQTGGNLPQTLERLAEVMRSRVDFRRHFRAQTAGGKLAMTVIAGTAVFALCYITFWKSDYMERLLEGPTGWTMLAMVALLQFTGIMWIMYLLRTDY